MSPVPRTCEVAIVGAGLSGLVAARRLVQGGVDEIVVLEAGDRVGGRTLNHQVDSEQVIELGGQWAARSHERLLSLARELGVGVFPTYDEGRNVLWLRGHRYLYRGNPPLRADPTGLVDFAQSAWRLDLLSRRVPIGAPWAARRASHYDAVTFQAWLSRATRTSTARAVWAIAAALTFGGAPHDVSLLYVLHHVRGAGGVACLLDVTGGAQELRFDGGSQALSLALAEAVAPRVHLGRPVARIVQHEDALTIEHGEGTLRASRAVVAMSPPDAERIVVEPPLPHARRRLQQRVTMARGLKVQAVYPEAFWRTEGLSGQAVSDEGALAMSFDNSPPSGRPGVLVGFATYDPRVRLALPSALEFDAQARRRATLGSLARYFGASALRPTDYIEHNWGNEPFLHGCIPALPPGTLTECGPALTAPVGSLHWAGAEAASTWDGYMEGAVQSGERAAAEILDRR